MFFGFFSEPCKDTPACFQVDAVDNDLLKSQATPGTMPNFSHVSPTSNFKQGELTSDKNLALYGTYPLVVLN